MKKNIILVLPLLIVSLVFLKKSLSEREQLTNYINNHAYSNISSEITCLDEVPKKDRPDLAMYQNYLMMMDPVTKTVPTERIVSAFQKLKSVRHARVGQAMDAIPGVSWQERGPNNVGGRTRALMWDPNDATNQKLWAAGVAGGIWFNDNIIDANSSWQNVNDFMSNLAVTTLAYNPSNPQEFYAGTGEGYFNGDAVRGGGIFKSIDGGSTWNLLSSTENSTFHYVQKVVVSTNGTILAATRNNGIQRSIDGGVSWSTVLNSSSTGANSSRAADIEVGQNGDIYASLGIFNTGSVHRSTDDGLTWSPITPPGGTPERIELAVSPSSSSETSSTVIYAVASSDSDVTWFQKSIDGGTNWTSLTIPQYREQNCATNGNDFTRSQAWYDLILGVHPTNSDIVFAGGINVLKSDDGGGNMAEISYWTGGCDTYVHADVHAFAFRPDNPNELIVGSDGGISYSSNAGSSSDPTFSDRNKDYNVTQFYAVAAENTSGSDYFIAGAQDNGTQQFTTANGLSTTEINGGDGAFCFIDQDDSNFQISSYIRNVYDLHNASGQFVTNLANDQESGRFINPADYDDSADILYSAGDADELKRIIDVTTTPSSQSTVSLSLNGEQISALRANAFTPDRLFIATGSGGVYRVDDASQTTPTLTDITNNLSQAGYISSIDIGTTDDQLIVTFSSFGTNSVWYTTDGGTSWLNKDNDGSLPDIPVRWALFNPNNTEQVMLATELGVWSTNSISAANPAWEQSSTNLANVRCDMLQYRTSDRLVVVATHGRGIFTTDAFTGDDVTPPLISSIIPDDNDLEIRLDVDLVFSFNEPVNVGSGNIIIQRVSDNSEFESIDVQSNQISISNGVVTVNPSVDFEPLTEYRVLIDANTFADDFNNQFEGFLDTEAWTFTTFDGDEPPVIISSIPDQSVAKNSTPIELDLSTFFSDPDSDPISYDVVSNTNDQLLSTDITGSILTITIASNQTGVGEITIEGISNGKSISDAFQIIVSPPALYSQSGAVVGGSPSQLFPDFSNSELETSDNFVVSAAPGASWYIEGVSVVGSNNGDVPNSAFFRIYSDESGLPGELVYESEVLPIIPTTDASDFQISLDDPVELATGNYWLSVLDVQDFGDTETQWFWRFYEGGDDYAKRDPDQLLGGAWASDWELDGNGRNLVFSLLGFESLAGPSDLILTEDQGEVILEWTDNADSETNYIVERAVGEGGSFSEIASLESNVITYSDPVISTNETIRYKVFALDGGGNKSGEIEADLLTIPGVPTLSEVTNSSFDRFTINWLGVDNASEFILDVSEANDFSSFLQGFENLNIVGQSSLVSNLDGSTYFYRVAALNSSGTSPFSDLGTFTLDPLGVIAENDVSIYPNPSRGQFFVEGMKPSTRLKVYDLSGKVIQFRTQATNMVDISDQESGTYLLQLEVNGEVITKTVIKK